MSPQLTSRLTYPNPFSPSGITFDLPDKARVTLKIFDKAGREVTTLIDNEALDPGTHHVDLGPESWNHSPSEDKEIYFYRLSAEYGGKSYVDTKKIILTES
ncbi:MAG TPA: T9SS type A sorting domain-containing protein [Bacteroidota bacterium]|nr:T9SS type A sorting domain-containing protein [Bacteroidota bacterium]